MLYPSRPVPTKSLSILSVNLRVVLSDLSTTSELIRLSDRVVRHTPGYCGRRRFVTL